MTRKATKSAATRELSYSGKYRVRPTDDGFAERAMRYFQAAAGAAKKWYDDHGRWLPASKSPENRERLWICFALYSVGECRLADAVIRAGFPDGVDYERYFSIFDNNIAAAILAEHDSGMTPWARSRMEDLVRTGFGLCPGNRQPDYQYHGFNDNMPSEATVGLILGGERLDSAGAIEHGLWNLRQMRGLLVRCGINSEFNSPTYTPATLHAMALIGRYAKNREARRLARGIEGRLWIDLAARFHPGTGRMAGPHSRAYTVDDIGHVTSAAGLLWFVLGDVAKPSPMELFRRPRGLVVHHEGDYPFNIAQMCCYAAGAYHVPAAARRMFAEKEYPFRAVATAEVGEHGPDFPARVTRIETVHFPDFSVGTATTPLYGGEYSNTYHVTYKRKADARDLRDVQTIYRKTLLDDAVPGMILEAPGRTLAPNRRPPFSNFAEVSHAPQHANTVAMQSGATVLLLSQPHLSLGGAPASWHSPAADPRRISALSEMVIFPCHFGGVDEIRVGECSRKSWAGPVGHGQWIGCRRGRLLVAFRPLAYSRRFGPVAITLEKHNRYEVIRHTFYRGPKRTFTREQLRQFFGGFVAEHASVAEFPSLAAFLDYLAGSRISDYFWVTRRVCYRRPSGKGRPDLEMALSWTPGSTGTCVAAINGRPLDMPIVAIDGVRRRELPSLREPFQPVPFFFPWRSFKVPWGEVPYAIGDGGVSDPGARTGGCRR